MPSSRLSSPRRLVRLVLPALLAGVLAGSVSSPSAGDSGAAGTRRWPGWAVHTVAEGETLWALAGRYAPGEDPRRFVHATAADNDLPGPVILPGQRLKLRRR